MTPNGHFTDRALGALQRLESPAMLELTGARLGPTESAAMYSKEVAL